MPDYTYGGEWNHTHLVPSDVPVDGTPVKVGDALMYDADSMGVIGFRRPQSGELPDAIVQAVHEEISGDNHFYQFITADSGRIKRISGVHGAVLNRTQGSAVYWQPDNLRWSLESGILAGYVYRHNYTFPLADAPYPNRTYIVPVSDTAVTITQVAPGGNDGDRLIVLNPANTKTTLRLDSTPGVSGGDILIAPGNYINALRKKGVWTMGTDDESLTTLDMNLSTEWIRRHSAQHLNMRGALFAKVDMKTLQKDATFAVQSGAPSGVIKSSDGKTLYLPEPSDSFVGYVAEGWYDGALQSRAYAMFGQGEQASTLGLMTRVIMYKPPQGSNTSALTIGVESRREAVSGRLHLKLTAIANDTYPKAVELRLYAMPGVVSY